MARQQPRIINIDDYRGGLNQRDSRIKIGDNEAAELVNFIFDDDGSLSKRKGSSKYNSSVIAASPLHSLYRYVKSATDFKELLAVVASTLYKGNDGAGTFSSVGALTSANDATFLTWKDICFIANGTVFKTYNGTTMADVAGTPPIGKYIVFHKSRIYVAGNTSSPNRLYFSDVDSYTSWTPGSNYVDIRSDDGDEITAISPLDGGLMIYKHNSIWMLAGTDSTNFFLTPVIDGIGCYANRSLVSYGGSHYFLHRTGVYIYNGGKVHKISDKVEKTIYEIPDAYIGNAAGVVYKERYYLSYTQLGETQNKRILVFDTRYGGWSVFSGINARVFSLWESFRDLGELYSGDSVTGFAWESDTGVDDDGSDISCLYTSKNFDMGISTIQKHVLYCFLSYLEINSTLNMVFRGERETSGVITYDLASVSGGILDSFMLDTDILGEILEAFKEKSVGDIVGRNIRVSISEESSKSLSVYGMGFEYNISSPEDRRIE
jgi:hypothetical protein